MQDMTKNQNSSPASWEAWDSHLNILIGVVSKSAIIKREGRGGGVSKE